MSNVTDTSFDGKQLLKDSESNIYRRAITVARYNQSTAAKLLGVSRGTLRTKLKEYFPGEFIKG